MVEVCLIRHAIAENRDATRWPDDAARPLTLAGAVRFRRAARGLRQIVPSVELVLSSPYVRAWETAWILHEEAHWPAPERCDALQADRSPRSALEELAEHRARRRIALVGHEPYLSSLASLLLAGDESLRLELKKGGAMLLAFTEVPTPGEALLRWSVTPKILLSIGEGA